MARSAPAAETGGWVEPLRNSSCLEAGCIGRLRDHRPIHASVASCPTPSRRGLARPADAAPAARRPALTASRHEANAKSWVGTKKRAYRSNKETGHFLPVSLFDRRRFFVPTCCRQDAALSCPEPEVRT